MENPKYNTGNGYSIIAPNSQINDKCSQKNFYAVKGSFFGNCGSSNSPFQDFSNSSLGHGDDGTVIVKIPSSGDGDEFWDINRFSRGSDAARQRGAQNSRNSNNQSSNNQSQGEVQTTQNQQQTTTNQQQITLNQQQTTQITTANLQMAPFLFSTEVFTTSPFLPSTSSASGAVFNFQTFRSLAPPDTTPLVQNFSAAVPAPEPATWILFGTTLFLLAIFTRFRQKKVSA